TTKSDMRMADTLRSLLGTFSQPAGAGHLAGRGSPATGKEFFLVAAKLPLHLAQHHIDRRDDVLVVLGGHKVVLVLSLDNKLDGTLLIGRLGEIDGDLDQGQAFKNMEQFFGLLANDRLVLLAEMAVANGNLHLHGSNSLFPL